MNELKPCPFCGSTDVAVEHDEEYWTVVFGTCLTCDAQGPTVGFEQTTAPGKQATDDKIRANARVAKVRAAELWNRRT